MFEKKNVDTLSKHCPNDYTINLKELIMARRIHAGNAEDSLLMHKHHMTPQTPSWVMVANNFKRLVPWSY
jgi:hypothetical protein